jgi:hypothetical protein
MKVYLESDSETLTLIKKKKKHFMAYAEKESEHLKNKT